jgi:phage-related tail fiber protein
MPRTTTLSILAVFTAASVSVCYAQQPPIGTILDYGGVTPPPGYLFCNGAPLNRSTYAALFAVIGTQFGGGDGVSTFNLPDLRGRFTRGVDGGAGNDPDAASRTQSKPGGSTGDAVGSLQADATGPHSHRIKLLPSAGTQPGSAAAGPSDISEHFEGAIQSSGTGIRSESRPKNVSVHKIIKVE